jgi:hypothetical protein
MVAFTVGDEGFTSLAGYPGSEEAEGDAEELLVGQVSQIKLHLQDAIDKVRMCFSRHLDGVFDLKFGRLVKKLVFCIYFLK